jgi:hypothetical protein
MCSIYIYIKNEVRPIDYGKTFQKVKLSKKLIYAPLSQTVISAKFMDMYEAKFLNDAYVFSLNDI